MARLIGPFLCALACGAVGASQANAAPAVTEFETFGIVCEARGRTLLTPVTQLATRDPDPNIAGVYSLVPPECRGTVKVTGFSWSNLDRSDFEVTKRGKRSTVIARITGTITGTVFRVTNLQTTDLESVRFDGFSLARPAIVSSALIGRNWPSSCNLSDSAVLSQQVPTSAQTLLAAALQEDPDLRVRTLLNGATEVVSYRPISDSVRRPSVLPSVLNATPIRCLQSRSENTFEPTRSKRPLQRHVYPPEN